MISALMFAVVLAALFGVARLVEGWKERRLDRDWERRMRWAGDTVDAFGPVDQDDERFDVSAFLGVDEFEAEVLADIAALPETAA